MGPDAELARTLASLARGLRRALQARLGRETAAGDGDVLRLQQEVARTLVVQDPREFADAWAQTLVYLLLAARWLGPSHDLTAAISRVDGRLGLLVARLLALAEATALRQAVARIELPEVDDDPVMRFYEAFLAAYDPRQRAARGVYFTPAPVVHYLVETTDAALRDTLKVELGLADPVSWADVAAARGMLVPDGVDPACPFVQVVDPAAGTGTFLIAVIRRAHATMTARWIAAGLDAAGRRLAWSEYARTSLLPRLHGVERLLAPWAISALRLSMLLAETGVEGALPGPVLLLGDTLAGPDLVPGPISVVLGNPPYERETPSSGGGGWIRGGTLLTDFVAPARRAGAGGHVKNLYNLYVYFWRWACWQVFERRPQAPGIVAMVTAASFLRGPGFVGMRGRLRECAPSIHVLDLEGDGRGARASDNVFAVTVPVAATTLVRSGLSPGTGVQIHRAVGDRRAKLDLCARVTALGDLAWTPAPGDPWRGRDGEAFDAWPALVDLFPWQHSGAQWKRTWPVATEPEVLARRWQALVGAASRAALFRETRDRAVDSRPPALLSPGLMLSEGTCVAIAEARELPPVRRYGFRALDRRWCLADARLGDFLRPVLWRVAGPRQVYLCSLLTDALGPGPAAMVSAEVPDLHFFCGRGGKDVVPLWRDPEATAANIGAGALSRLRGSYGAGLRAEDVLAYVYALLSAPGYTTRFAAALAGGGPRVPLIRDADVWSQIAALGHRAVHLHSFGARWFGEGDAPAVTSAVRCLRAPTRLPTRVAHVDATLTLFVEDEAVGVFAPVSAAAWEFALSGYRPVPAWVASRLAGGAGRRSSRLDAIQPERWTADTTAELLELLTFVEAGLALGPALDEALARACAGPCWLASELPAPEPDERREPGFGDRSTTRPA